MIVVSYNEYVNMKVMAHTSHRKRKSEGVHVLKNLFLLVRKMNDYTTKSYKKQVKKKTRKRNKS